MSNLTNNKLSKLQALQTQGGFWYITKQNLVFRDLCFMAKILEAWNDRVGESYESFFNNHKTLEEYGSFPALAAHRATKNCDYIGLTRTPVNGKYSAKNLSQFYFSLKKLCKGNFDNLIKYSTIINKQLERMYIDSDTTNQYTVSFKISPIMFLFKILLLIGDVTKNYCITTSEFKLFVATAQEWNDYFEVVESIIRYRADRAYQLQCDANKSKVADVRYNILAQNHSQLDVTESKIAIKTEEIRAIRKKVAEYELKDHINSVEDMYSADIVSSFLPSSPASLSAFHLSLLAALRTKPFVLLAGISGTGKSRIVRKLAQACWEIESNERNAQVPENFCMVQVKPNWHDSSELIGYVSRIGGESEYIAGDFLRFVVKAWENPDVPHFLCLDEMNLAPVEQYFAEYLSIVESRRLHPDGKIHTDPIVKKVAETWYHTLVNSLTDNELLCTQFLTEGIALPPNLLVVGTVNMDETTYTFSRKVLDRAMVIEMNEVNLSGGLSLDADEFSGVTLQYSLIVPQFVEAKDFYAEHQETCDQVIENLNVVNNVLDGTPFKIAYRTRNEILLYVVNRIIDEVPQNQALDEAINMKILSRIEGDKNKVITKNGEPLLPKLFDAVKLVVGDTENSPSLQKLEEMKQKLANQYYCTYWN